MVRAAAALLVGPTLGAAFLLGCSTRDEAPISPPNLPNVAREIERAEKAERARIARTHPLEAVVTGVHLSIRESADPESRAIAWVRKGAHLHLKRDGVPHPHCRSGFHAVHPHGYVCVGRGIELDRAPNDEERASIPRDASLPYDYYFVKESHSPEFHRLPSRKDQRAVAEALLALPDATDERAKRTRRDAEPTIAMPPIVQRLLDRSFFLAGVGRDTRADRVFVRTVRGSFVPLSRLVPREAPEFRGVELEGSRSLPIAFAVRAGIPQRARERADGSVMLVEDPSATSIARHAIVEGWKGRTHVENQAVHALEGDRFLKAWFVGVAEVINPPFRPETDEPWVHVDLGEQTLVLYRGERPVFATLVSTGVDPHLTPTGVFSIHRKMITDTMSNLGPEAGDDRYRIEDVPWTQYFAGSIALHGAFWHSQFGLPRSHGCVNLSPHDARRIFKETWPEVPAGFHGVSADRTVFRASRVVVTE